MALHAEVRGVAGPQVPGRLTLPGVPEPSGRGRADVRCPDGRGRSASHPGRAWAKGMIPDESRMRAIRKSGSTGGEGRRRQARGWGDTRSRLVGPPLRRLAHVLRAGPRGAPQFGRGLSGAGPKLCGLALAGLRALPPGRARRLREHGPVGHGPHPPLLVLHQAPQIGAGPPQHGIARQQPPIPAPEAGRHRQPHHPRADVARRRAVPRTRPPQPERLHRDLLPGQQFVHRRVRHIARVARQQRRPARP